MLDTGGKATERAVVLGVNNNNDNFNINANDNLDNERPAREWNVPFPTVLALRRVLSMKTYKGLWKELCSFHHLQFSYELAKKQKSGNPRVIEFYENWRFHLCTLLRELRNGMYRPLPLRKFVLRDPKTRIICVSDFRDRVVHHALVSVLQPIFEPRFIYDSYASRKGKGTLAALQRFDNFKRKVSRNGTLINGAKDGNQVKCFVLKADIKSYFEAVDYEVLISILRRYVKDEKIILLARVILDNYDSGYVGKGMPLGNWTSQFFANMYLNELDHYVKQVLRAKYYIRYVDDFVILHPSKEILEDYLLKISVFLREKLKLELHPNKSKIIPLGRGVNFLGFRVFYHHKLVRQKNFRKIKFRLEELLEEYGKGNLQPKDVLEVFQGWTAYAQQGNTHRLREKLKEYVEEKLSKKEG